MIVPKARTVTGFLEPLAPRTDVGARFIDLVGNETFYSYAEIIQRARCAAGALVNAGLERGDRVVLVLPTSIDFFDALLGAQLAGGVAVAIYPPFRLGRLDEYWTRMRVMLDKIGARFLVTEPRIRKLLGPGVAGVPSVRLVMNAHDLHSGPEVEPVPADPDGIAFLQFTSGTTNEPRAVIMTHENLAHNLAMIASALGPKDLDEARRGAVCWLPLYHDMGLVGCLYSALYYSGTVTYMSPENFIAKPALWLQTLSRYRAIVSPAPQFAYGLCLKRVKDTEMDGVDLSSWEVALNGAEPIDVLTLQRFSERFRHWGFRPEAMTPVYGLAEAGLGVSFSSLNTPPLVREFDQESIISDGVAVSGPGRRLVSVGVPLPGVAVRIRDENDRDLSAEKIGRICVSGPSITKGYFGDPTATADVLRDGWLDTGDIGFLDASGQLYIVGRVKDLIIIRGRNYAPQDIESLLLDVPGIRTGCTVAAGIVVEGQGEELAILAETKPGNTRPPADIAADIQAAVLSGLGIKPYHIELVQAGSLPRTSSGKLRRSEAMKRFFAGDLGNSQASTFKLLAQIARSQFSWAKFRASRMRRGTS